MNSPRRNPGIPYKLLNDTIATMALVVRSALPIATTLAVRSGAAAALTGQALSVARGIASYLWAHSSDFGGVARDVFRHLPDALIPGYARRGGKGKGKRAATNLLGGGGGIPRHMSAPVSTGTYFHNLGFLDMASATFEGQPGMRCGFRLILGAAVNVFTDSTNTGFNAACGFLGSMEGGTYDSTVSLYCTNDQNVTSTAWGRGNAVILHPGFILQAGNTSNPTSRLSRIAQMYCKYRFRHINIGYCSNVSTSTAGALAGGLISTLEGTLDETASWNACSISQVPGGSIIPVWGTDRTLAEYTYTGPEWWQCNVDTAAAPGANGYFWTPAGRDDIEEAVQVVFACAPVGQSPSASSQTNANLTKYGWYVMDALVEFCGICPVPWDVDRSASVSVGAATSSTPPEPGPPKAPHPKGFMRR